MRICKTLPYAAAAAAPLAISIDSRLAPAAVGNGRAAAISHRRRREKRKRTTKKKRNQKYLTHRRLFWHASRLSYMYILAYISILFKIFFKL